jgi:putative peptidoglycan lipid II flippase
VERAQRAREPVSAKDPPEPELGSGAGGVAAASATVAAWTLVSRATGFVRVAVVAAALGATYLGNTYGATNYIPNLTLELVSGSVLGSLLVPPLVRALDARGRSQAERLAGTYLGVILVALTVVALLAAVAAPLLLRIFAAGVANRDVAGEQLEVGWALLALQVWQIPLYGLVQVATAAQTARGRFALAAAAPIIENIGIMAVMGAYVLIFGTHRSIADVGTPAIVLLGGGSTLAVALHAAAQWWGARRSGITLRPRLGWREPEVRELMASTRHTLRLTILTSGRTFGALIVANTVAGGVVAFQIGLNFLWLPGALGGRPVAVALQPLLARLHHRGAVEKFKQEFVRGFSVVMFFAMPAGVFYVVLADPLAELVASGRFHTDAGLALMSATLAGLGVGVAGDAGYVMAFYAAFAKDDVRSPFRAMLVAVVVGAIGMTIAAVCFDGRDTLLALGLAYSISALVGAWRLAHAVDPRLARDGVGMSVVRSLAAAAVMGGLAYLVGVVIPGDELSRGAQAATLAAAALVGGAAYFALQRAWHAPELEFVRGMVRRGGSRDAS